MRRREELTEGASGTDDCFSTKYKGALSECPVPSLFQETVGLEVSGSKLEVKKEKSHHLPLVKNISRSPSCLTQSSLSSSTLRSGSGHRSRRRATGWRRCSVRARSTLCRSAALSCQTPEVMARAEEACTPWSAACPAGSSHGMAEHLRLLLCR